MAEYYENRAKRGRDRSRRLKGENARIALRVLSCEPETSETSFGEDQVGKAYTINKPLTVADQIRIRDYVSKRKSTTMDLLKGKLGLQSSKYGKFVIDVTRESGKKTTMRVMQWLRANT